MLTSTTEVPGPVLAPRRGGARPTAAQLLAGDEDMHTTAAELERVNRDLLESHELRDVFFEVDLVGDFDRGAVTVAQANGVRGALARFGEHAPLYILNTHFHPITLAATECSAPRSRS